MFSVMHVNCHPHTKDSIPPHLRANDTATAAELTCLPQPKLSQAMPLWLGSDHCGMHHINVCQARRGSLRASKPACRQQSLRSSEGN